MSTTLASRRWKGLALIAAAQFMVIMDTSIIGVALPEMQADLGFTQEDLSWVFNAYVVAFGGLLLLGGRLSDLLGARKVFTTGWLVLLAGSVLAGLAATPASSSPAGRPRRRRGADRAVGADSADDAVRRQPQGAHQGAGALRRGGTGRRHRGRLPRRRHHRVPVLAVGVLPQRADRRARAPRHARPVAGRRRPAGSVDLLGALTVTGGLGTAVYAVVRAPEVGWASRRPGSRWRGRGAAGRLSCSSRSRDGSRSSGWASSARRTSARRTRPAAPRRRLDPDVVLPEPLPAAGPRLQRLPRRRRPAADDVPHHARHDRPRPAGDGRFGPRP